MISRSIQTTIIVSVRINTSFTLHPLVREMEGYAECKACCEGVLIPFYGPEGHVVYFCNNCRARFSAYYEEPMMDGFPVFLDTAYYSTEEDHRTQEPFTSGKLMDAFRDALAENPPVPLPLEGGCCPFCSGPLNPGGECLDLCYLPNV